MSFDPMSVPAGVIVIAGGLAGVAYIGRGVYKIIIKTDKIMTFLFGDLDTGEQSLAQRIDGVSAKVGGLDVRLQRVETQLSPNGGGSMYDKVSATLRGVQGQDDRERGRGDGHHAAE